MKTYRPPTKATAVEKLVCEHGDFFCVVIGMFRPYSKEGLCCKAEMYPRAPHNGEGKCQECQARPNDLHRLHCTAEHCPHCTLKLVNCLGRKHASASLEDFNATSDRR